MPRLSWELTRSSLPARGTPLSRLPLLAITLVPVPARVIVTFTVVLAALTVTGAASAALGGAVAMGVTYGIGSLIGASGI